MRCIFLEREELRQPGGAAVFCGAFFMLANGVTLICLAYLAGLLLTSVPGTLLGLPSGAIAMLLIGALVPWVGRWGARSLKKRLPLKSGWWLAAGTVGLLAVLQFHLRLPQPAANDLCRLLNSPHNGVCAPIATAIQPEWGQQFQVTGTIATVPRRTRSNRFKFQLAATELVATQDGTPMLKQAIGGLVYVTLPAEQGEALYPGLKVTIVGSLYKPSPAANPGGFDFQKSLAKAGVFSGLTAESLQLAAEPPPPPLSWLLRQRIVRSQEAGLGETEGHLLSAMAIGKSAVDVSTELQDEFRKAGLTHALAASGAQVSLLIGVLMALTRRLPKWGQLAIGNGVILGYIGLAGAEASVLRAGLMGSVVLFALSADRKVKPLSSLLFAATLLLLYDPSLIWDLGFQLSFLATLGLLVTVPILSQWLDWLPSAIAALVAVPLAASLWTLPIQLFAFSIFLPYSLLINTLAGLLIALVSLGGMASAALALLYPPIGSLAAGLLHYPLWLLIELARWGNRLPGSQYAVGTISPWQVVMLYGLIVLVWQWQRLQPYWWLALGLGISLVAVPAGIHAANLQQVTLLATAREPVLVIQDKGAVILINSGDEQETRFTVLPFLQRQGINQIDWAIAPRLKTPDLASWKQINATTPIRKFYYQPARAIATPERTQPATPDFAMPDFLQPTDLLRLSGNQMLRWGAMTIQPLTTDAAAVQIHVGQQDWLLLDSLQPADYHRAKQGRLLPQSTVLWWTGRELDPALLQAVDPKVAIAPKLRLKPDSATQRWLTQHQVQVHSIEQAGAMQWQGDRGFMTMAEQSEAP